VDIQADIQEDIQIKPDPGQDQDHKVQKKIIEKNNSKDHLEEDIKLEELHQVGIKEEEEEEAVDIYGNLIKFYFDLCSTLNFQKIWLI